MPNVQLELFKVVGFGHDWPVFRLGIKDISASLDGVGFLGRIDEHGNLERADHIPTSECGNSGIGLH